MAIAKFKALSSVSRKGYGIRTKILVSFLAVSLVAVGIISIFALRNMVVVGNTARQNSISLGNTAVSESVAALEDSGRRIIQLRATIVAKEIQIFLERNPGLSLGQLMTNKDLINIAVQQVGQAEYTMVYGSDGRIYFHHDPAMIGADLAKVSQGVTEAQTILTSGLSTESSGYYDWEDSSGNVRSKYMAVVPLKETSFIVAAATYIDEFSKAAETTESKINAEVLSTTQYIEKQMNLAQWTFVIIIICMIAIISALSSFIARTITDPILALTKGAEVIEKGDLDYKIKISTGDETEMLANQFNAMTSALKESYSNLEQKVADRTKRERQRAEQLRTINEISRKISSIMKLDELLPFVANLLRDTFNYHNVNIFLFEPDSGKLILKEICLSGYKGVIPLEVPLEMGEEGLVAWVAQTGEALMVNDVTKESRYRYIEQLKTTKSELAVPVKIGSKILGVLDIESNEVEAFSESDLFTAQTLADQLATAIENARLYQQTAQMAVMEERHRMAREIHDTLAQGFTGIILQLEAAEQAMERKISDGIVHINKAKSLAKGSLNEARRSVWNLRAEPLERLSLVEALRQEVGRFAQVSNVKARFEVSSEGRNLPMEVETALLRICQESLANIRKYANATEVKVDLAFGKSDVSLIIRDNGGGIREPDTNSKSKHRGFGLTSMQERVRNLEGVFEVQSEAGKGTLVKAVIPVM